MKRSEHKWSWAQLLGAHEKKEEKMMKLNREHGIWKVYEDGTLLYASTSFARAYKYLYGRAKGGIKWGCRY